MGSLLDALPAGGSAASVYARERMLYDYAQRGFLTWTWQDVAVTAGGHSLVFRAMTDGVKLEGVRIEASATLSQLIADEIDAMLPTAKLCDLIWQKAVVQLAPLTRQPSNTTASMIDQSNRIDAAIGNRAGLIGNIGKYWVLAQTLQQDSPGCGQGALPIKVPNVAANYGWYEKSGPDAVTSGLHVIQPLSRCYDRLYTDSSQICQLVAKQAVLDGKPMELPQVLAGAQATLVSAKGPLQFYRQPGAELGWPGGLTAEAPPATSAATSTAKKLLYTFAGGVVTALAFKLVSHISQQEVRDHVR